MIKLYEVKKGLRVPASAFPEMFPDTESIIWFAKLYRLSAADLGRLFIAARPYDDLVTALTCGEHSQELQDYLVEVGYQSLIDNGDIDWYDGPPPKADLLGALWESVEVEVAEAIEQVADKIAGSVEHMTGKQGYMTFQSLMVLNTKRPTIGDHRAVIKHHAQQDHLLVLDVSGSMSEGTVKQLVEPVVGLGYMANAHLAIVSDTTTVWNPGEYTVESVLARAEYAGTHYETLAPLFTDRNWGTVITVADYDSSRSAREAIKKCNGTIEQVLDISLVSTPTYLSEVVGQLAGSVRCLMTASSDYSCI